MTLFKPWAAFLTVFFVTALTAVAQVVDDTDWTKVSPIIKHQHEWEGKSRALLQRDMTEQRIAASAVANTQTNYDAKFYDIFLRVNDTTKIIYGNVKIVAAATQDGVSQVQVDFYDNLTIDSIAGPSTNLPWSRLANVVTITLDRTYNTGEQFSFNFVYHGHPIEGGFQAFAFHTRTSGQIISSLSEPYFARTWWPCKDRPDDKADSFNIAVEVDSSFYCGSNGTLDSVRATHANTKTYYWRERYPMATYLFSVAISKFTVWYDKYVYNGGLDTMPIVEAVFPDWYAYSLSHWQNLVPNAIALQAQTFGQYPFITEKYGHSNFDWGGGMEHQTMTSMQGGTFGFSEDVTVHELTHQWTGDMITCNSWGHIWLNEGFASYGEAAYHLKKDGWAAYRAYMASQDFTAGGTIYISDTSTVGKIFGNIVYDKASWVVHMLRGVLGEVKFKAAIDAYMSSPYRFGSCTTEQFRDLVEATTGEDLHWFFQEWIYGTYRPSYRYSYFVEPAAGGGYDIHIAVIQQQTSSPQVFTMPIQFVANHTGHPADSITLWVDARQKLLTTHVDYPVDTLLFDPNSWILKYLTPETFGVYITSTQADISEAEQYKAYADTIQQIGCSAGPSLHASIYTGSLPPGLSIAENTGIISGTPADTGTYNFTVLMSCDIAGGYDEKPFSIHVKPGLCCVGKRGNVDGDAQDRINLVDLSALISYLTAGPFTPPCTQEANVDGDSQGKVNLVDLTALIDFLTGGPFVLPNCP